jgi:hypothetical protein
MNKTAVLISSCDRYQDLWKPFFTLFFKYWPDCPYPVYLSTNHGRYDDPRVKIIAMGDDTDWSSGFRSAMKMIPYQYVIILMEDYLLMKRVDTEKIERLITYMDKKKAGCLRLIPSPGPDLPCPDNEDVGGISKGSDYRLSLQAAIWNKNILLNLLRNGETAWELELKGTKRTNELDVPFLSVKNNPPIHYFCTAVVKGKWVKEAVDLCRKEGIEVNLKIRPMQTTFDLMIRSETVSNLIGMVRNCHLAIKK